MLEVDQVYFGYNEKKILEGLSFSAAVGEIIALIGISGSGKTTLFRLIAGLISPLKGKIAIAGLSHPASSQLITYMRQEDLLLPWRNVIDNLLLFTELGVGKKRNRSFIEHARLLLEKVGLSGCELLYPPALSGGMRQRVALARALLQNRPLMLLDEPFASLDAIMREQLYHLLREIRDQFKKTMVMVTHDFRDAFSLADRLLVLGKGKIISSYELPRSPCERNALSESFIQNIRNDLQSGVTFP
jgi:NitT/TauT family transport system ATP-binding protein